MHRLRGNNTRSSGNLRGGAYVIVDRFVCGSGVEIGEECVYCSGALRVGSRTRAGVCGGRASSVNTASRPRLP